MRTIEATDEEIAALHQLLHRAVLHSGMEVAEAALHWKRKLLAVTQEVLPKTNGASRQETISP